MPRPRKCRKVCHLPKTTVFRPVQTDGSEDAAGRDTVVGADTFAGGEPVIMTVDEYETIRLIDRQGFSQEECGQYMQIARTTVQQMYNTARRKLAAALVEGRALRIEGGDYSLCDGSEDFCGCGGCQKHRCMEIRSQ